MTSEAKELVQKVRLQNSSPFKQQIYFSLEDWRKAQPAARMLSAFLLVLIALNALLVFIDDGSLHNKSFEPAIFALCILSTLSFGLEYVARIWIAPLARGDKTSGRARLCYVLSPMGIIDLLSFLPVMLTWFIPAFSPAMNAIRIIRLVRLIKISRSMRGLRSLGRVFKRRRDEIVAAFMVLALLMIVASVLMYEVEHPVQPEQFDSVLTGLYWAITTMTSTGYGDLVPITSAGRVIGFLTMLFSIAVVAIPAGIFSAGFVEEFRHQDEQEKR